MLARGARRALAIAVAFLINTITGEIGAEPLTTIRNHGDAGNRVDLVILGDGYTAGELGTYAADVERFVQGLFAQEPFAEYQRYFNVHRIDVTSSESGADHPERNAIRNTALDATYNCNGIQRLICVNLTKVNEVLSRSASPDERDIVLVIVNDTEYGGSGGAVAVTSLDRAVVELILHELGHSFGLLADEYDTDPQLCNTNFEPAEPNVTRQTNRSAIKWNVGGGPPTGWIDPATPVPTPPESLGVPGLYQGARYCTEGLYRPTVDSKMRALFRPFEQINSEQLIKRIYNNVSPIDAVDPVDSAVTLVQHSSRTFRIATPEPLSGALEVSWSIDGMAVGSGNEFILHSSALTPGLHNVQAVVFDPTERVINDPNNLLSESLSWIVTVENPAVLQIAAPQLPEGEVKVTYAVNLLIAGGAPPYSVRRIKGSLPRGLSVNSDGISGMPREAGTSKFTLRATDQLGASADVKLTIRIFKALGISTTSLKSGKIGRAYTAAVKATSGKPPYSWTMTGILPPGLDFDPVTARISGTPSGAGTAELTFEVSDTIGGTSRKTLKLKIKP